MRSKNALKNIISSLLMQVVGIGCGFIVPILIIRSFGSEANGLVNSIAQFLAYITLLESGFGPVVKSVLYKYIAKNDHKRITEVLKSAEKFFRRVAVVFIVYIAVLCFVYPAVVSDQFGVAYTVSLLVIMAFGTFAEYFFGVTYTLFLQAKQKTYVTSYIQLITTILVTIAVVVVIKLGGELWMVKLISAFLFVLKPVAQKYYVERRYNIDLRAARGTLKIKERWDGLAQHVAAVIHSNTDIVVLTLFSTLSEVSVYTVYLLVVNGLKKIIQSFNNGIDASFGDMIAKNEMKQLNKKFRTYEFFFHTIVSVIFICAIVMITPFVGVYTNGVTDANYARPIFGVLITLAEFVWAVRLPYSSTVLAAGRFKQTKKGAWVEALINIVLSVILVFHFGIVGVAIGTLAAMFIRTIEFMYHNSKYILKRSPIVSFTWIPIIAIETCLAVAICDVVPRVAVDSYASWVMDALIVSLVAICVVVPINLILHKTDAKDLLVTFKKSISKKL